MQFAETFSVPSSNQRMWRSSASKETSFTFVNGFNQSMRFASPRQKPSGSRSDRAYISSYCAFATQARDFHCSGTRKISSDMWFSLTRCQEFIRSSLRRKLIQDQNTLLHGEGDLISLSPSTSAVSAPGRGGSRRMEAGVCEKWSGGLVVRQVPSLACGRS